MKVAGRSNLVSGTNEYDRGYVKIELPSSFKKFITEYIESNLSNYNPYLCQDEIAHQFAKYSLVFLKKIKNKQVNDFSIDIFLKIIKNSYVCGEIPVVFITNTPVEPSHSYIEPIESRGFNYAENKHDRLREFFYSEWFTWLIAALFNHDAIIHPSEHGGKNRFHLISPISNEDKRLRKVGASTDGVISGFVGEINYPIFLGKDGNIAGTCINASENRMVYVGKSKKDKRLFDRFLSTVRTMEILEFLLTSKDLLFIPNSYHENQNNVTHGRGELDNSEYRIPIGKENFSRRMHCRQYTRSRLRDFLPGLLGGVLDGV
ncbi:hypothetical protein [Candidatus Spongiihabitans sp.]|uniref:hypothetical protein n=1 Tax=Candidatus Spongiihabitans sp. TaxID=3101308 RepID=UPI003C6F4BBD